MWKLEPDEKSEGCSEQHLVVGERHVVGRKDCDILISRDQSISRVHAVLAVSHAEHNLVRPSCRPTLSVTDSSKYGTFVNGVKLTSGSERSLSCGDLLKFGVFETKYRVTYSPLVVCSSYLDAESKHTLSSTLLVLGGHFVSQWSSECTHLVMTSIKVTVKTICALITSIPIVKPGYFSSLVTAIRSRSTLPSPSSFWPMADELGINPGNLDLTPRPERRLLFQGKTFQFVHAQQHKRLSLLITLAGGTALCLGLPGERAEPRHDEGFCVVEASGGGGDSQPSSRALEWDARERADRLAARLRGLGLRAITEAEVGLAVIYCSTHTYCNPSARLPDEISCTNTNVAGATPSQHQALEPSLCGVPDSTLYAADMQASQLLARRRVKPATGSQSQRVDETLDKRSSSAMEITRQDPGRPGPAGTTGTVPPSAAGPTDEAVDDDSSSLQRRPAQPGHGAADSAQKPAACSRATITGYFQPACKKRARSADTSDESPVPAKVLRAAELLPAVLSSERREGVPTAGSLPTQPYPENGTRGEDWSAQAPREMAAPVPGATAGVLGVQGGNRCGVAPSEHSGTHVKKKKVFEGLPVEELSEEETHEGAGGPRAKQRRADSPPVKQEAEVGEAGKPGDRAATTLLLCKFHSLVLAPTVRRSHLPATPPSSHGAAPARNFKTFKKAVPRVLPTLPRVIAASDLFRHEEERDIHISIEGSQRTQPGDLTGTMFG